MPLKLISYSKVRYKLMDLFNESLQHDERMQNAKYISEITCTHCQVWHFVNCKKKGFDCRYILEIILFKFSNICKRKVRNIFHILHHLNSMVIKWTQVCKISLRLYNYDWNMPCQNVWLYSKSLNCIFLRTSGLLTFTYSVNIGCILLLQVR